MISTVKGPIDSQNLGVTMMHEHLAPRESVPQFKKGERFVKQYSVQDVIDQLNQAKKFGLESIVDCTPNCEYRDPETLVKIAEKTDLNIIAATGFYKEPRIPGFVYKWSVNKLADLMEKELAEGIENTGVKAGIIKVGTSKNKISRVEKKILEAAGKAHQNTGAPITTHTTLGTKGLDQIEIFEEEGVNPGKLIIGHSGLNSSFDYQELIAKHGAFIGFDTIGKESFEYVRMETAGINRFEFEKETYRIPDDVRVKRIKTLASRNLEGSIILSSDLTRQESYLNLNTFGTFGYSYLLHRFIPLLKEAGVSQEKVNEMLINNPRAIFD